MSEHAEPLTLKFRGERSYLHGTDIHAALTAAGGARAQGGVMEMHFHSLLRRQPDVLWTTERRPELRNHPSFRGEAVFGTPDKKSFAVLMESMRPVEERKPCNEKQVAALATMDVAAKTVRLSQTQCASAIEAVVFLNKSLHTALLPNVGTSWLFARLVLDRPLPADTSGDIALEMKQVLADKFTKTQITIGRQPWGYICFSLPA